MDEREQAVRLLAAPGGVVEIRAIAEDGTHSGYFDDPRLLAASAELLDLSTVHGIYVTLNELNPALLARRSNRVKMHLSRKDSTTADADIIRRRWFPVDIDPVRPGGVSSTDEEHEKALKKAEHVARWLKDQGFPEPVRADSGNGAHLLYRIDLPNDETSRDLVQRCLAALAERFNDSTCIIDTAVSNAARIWKLYGTVSRKGDATADRPHRRSRIIAVPDETGIVSIPLLKTLAAQGNDQKPTERRSPKTKIYEDPQAPLDLDAWLREHGIRVSAVKSWKGGRLFPLEECPFTTAHKDGAFVIQFENGAVHAGCHHAGCGGGRQRWQELRRMHEPEYAEREKPSPPPRNYALTDAGNGERLVARFGDDIRYCATNASWYLWNGALWEKDRSNRMYLLATRVARDIYDESRDAPTPDQAKALARWAITSENLRTRKAMIESATPLAAVELDAFDAREYLLNCRNGTLELDTLTLREHRREDLLTRSCGVAYDPSAECPQWNAHLDLIFDKDAEYISGFQAMCGYSLLQANPEQLLFILFGKGKNGKSKTIEVLAAILGDYAVNIAAESLMVHRCEGIRSDLARIAGARMATASEGEDGARLAESIIKQLTGEYAITVRRLYENEFEFTPTAKIWLTTNHEPVIRGTDDGIWRRIWMVPFTVQIAEEKRDPEIEKKLIAEGPGILNWCLEGLQRYFASGNRLVKPRKVSVATGNYRTVRDTVSYFLATECAFEPGRMIARSAFREMFEKWCEEEGIRHPIAPRRYATILKSYHIRSVKSGGERFWSGIRWKTEEERDACDQRELVQEPFLGFAGS
ncbi:MAG TPA: phage/plasmid primase, P4 family [Methanoregulaceae archaeon]|nr:phage/plasmid primase, P4 family [Methanoregulaceae archaeon]